MKLLAISCLVALLAGCASPHFGFYSSIGPSDSARLAIDASIILPRVYMPSATRFNVKQNADDAFGTTLITLLRQKGYAVAENPKFWDSFQPATNVPGHSFNYIVDEVGADQTRLTVVVEGSSLSRVYRMTDGNLVPIGFWSKKD